MSLTTLPGELRIYVGYDGDMTSRPTSQKLSTFQNSSHASPKTNSHCSFPRDRSGTTSRSSIALIPNHLTWIFESILHKYRHFFELPLLCLCCYLLSAILYLDFVRLRVCSFALISTSGDRFFGRMFVF